MKKPLLDKYATLSSEKSHDPIGPYDPVTETLSQKHGCDQGVIWLTGSEMTKTMTDPTNDEATDR